MKYLYGSALTALLFLIAIPAGAQQTISFRVGYQPNTQYRLSQQQISRNTINYIASEEMLAQLEQGGVTNPTVVTDSTITVSLTRTGAGTPENFPIEIEMLESSNAALGNGTMFYGFSEGGMARIDSIANSGMDGQMQQLVMGAVESMMNQMQFPEQQLSPGEGFQHAVPLKLPMGPIVLEMEIISDYLLEKVAAGLAYFKVDQQLQMKTEVEGYEINASGTGTGKVTYDVQQQFFRAYHSEMQMEMEMQLEAFTLELQMMSITDQQTEIVNGQ
jgi:hypothetical protein